MIEQRQELPNRLSRLAQQMKAQAAKESPGMVWHAFNNRLRIALHWKGGTWRLGVWRPDGLPSDSEVAACRQAFGVPERPREQVRMAANQWRGYVFVWDGARGDPLPPQAA